MANVGDTISFYCMKEKKKVNAEVISAKKTKRGTTVNKGVCPNCKTKLCVISK